MLRPVKAVFRVGGAAAALLLAGAAPAAAHSVAGSYDYPLPTWLWLVAACAAVVVTFAIAVRSPVTADVAAEPPPAGSRSPGRVRLVGVLEPAGEVLSVGLMTLAILSCLAGSDDPNHSFGAIWFWVVWWVSLGVVSTLVADLYAWLSPWGVIVRRVLAPLAGDPDALGRIPYPAGLGRWPAAAALLGFSWLELVYEPAREPHTLGLLLVAYSVVALLVPLVIGIDAW
jgi:hypothetical protein